MTQELTIFRDKRLRIEYVNGEPYFNVQDICRDAELQNVNAVLQRLRNSEVFSKYPAMIVMIDTQTETGIRSMAYVNEMGMYEIVGNSRKRKAREYYSRIISTLPELRKQANTPQIINIDEIVKLAVSEVARQIYANQGMRDMQFDVRIAALETATKPKKRIPKLTTGHEDKRAIANNLINEIVESRDLAGWEVGKLRNDYYRKLGDAHGKDFIAEGKAANKKTLDIIQKAGLMDELIKIIRGE